uniref:Uncharacterized protein n=2 Tax=Nothobranchius TaxID=28779 RepID=A0A1A7Z957_NOTFU
MPITLCILGLAKKWGLRETDTWRNYIKEIPCVTLHLCIQTAAEDATSTTQMTPCHSAQRDCRITVPSLELTQVVSLVPLQIAYGKTCDAAGGLFALLLCKI